MRKIILFIAFFCALSVHAQIKWNQQSQSYIDQYKDIAIQQMNRWKIPASITLAQGLLESGAGKGYLATKGNNHFGIKCHNWTGRTIHKDDDRKNDCFRAYDSAYDSYDDHSRFLASGSRYQGLFKLKLTDYKGWAKGLKAAGYATNPRYAQQLIDIIELYRLYEYDNAKTYNNLIVKQVKSQAQTQSSGTGFSLQVLHAVKQYNGNYYVVARKGDTFKSIGKEFFISRRKLARYNERDKNDAIEAGEIIWLMKKARKLPKSEKGRLHYVKAGESMYTIAQKYGIRVKYLYKINHLEPYYQAKVGDALLLR